MALINKLLKKDVINIASTSFTSNTVTSISSPYPRSIKVTCKSTPNTAKNSSVVDYTISTPTGTTTNWVYAYGIKVVINGTTVYSISSQTKIYGSKTLKTGSLTVPHNPDGKKTINVSISAKLYYSTENSTGGGNMTLDTIARTSNISAAVNKTLGNACSISWTPASSSFTYSLKLSLGSWSNTIQNIKPARTTSYTYTGYPIPLTVASQLPNATTGTMTATLYTYSGSTLIGTSSKTFIVTVPSTVVPTLSTPNATIDNSSNKVVKGWNVAVAGYTKATITTIASPVYSSTINNFTISDGYSTTQNGTLNSDGTKALSYTGGVLTSGSKKFTIIAKDSRGRTSAAKTTSAITVYDYAKPSITAFTVVRDTADATKAVAKAQWSYSSVNGNNNIKKIVLEYKKSSATDWTEYTGEITNITNSTGVKLSINGGFVIDSSYSFRISVSDALNTSLQKTASISSRKVTMDFRAGGNGVAIGKICEKDAFEVAMPHYALSPFYPQGGIYPVVITSSTDLNTLITPGIYTASNSSLLNAPVTGDTLCSIEVLRIGSLSKCFQKITYANGNGIRRFERYWNNQTDIWYNWECTTDTRNPVLWSSTGWYMQEGQNITLSEPISKQANGIILTFAPYYISPGETSNTAKSWDNIDVFVSKGSITGSVKDFPLFGMTFTLISIKKLTITDTKIIGNDTNNTKGTTNGITWDNTKFVLTKVTGC